MINGYSAKVRPLVGFKSGKILKIEYEIVNSNRDVLLDFLKYVKFHVVIMDVELAKFSL